MQESAESLLCQSKSAFIQKRPSTSGLVAGNGTAQPEMGMVGGTKQALAGRAEMAGYTDAYEREFL